MAETSQSDAPATNGEVHAGGMPRVPEFPASMEGNMRHDSSSTGPGVLYPV